MSYLSVIFCEIFLEYLNISEKKFWQVEVNNAVDWRKKHWRTIYLNYKKTLFFDKYAAGLEDFYKRDWRYLTDLNEAMLKWFLRQLNIEVDYCKATDLRFQGHKEDLILDMCKKLKSDIYIFGALGKDYAHRENFARQGIKIYFQDYQHPVYRQTGEDFLPYMSVIDLLFNEGGRSLEILMSGNITKQDLLTNQKLYE